MSSPRPNTKLDSPARSPLGSGATSSDFAARCIDRDAAVSAAVSACCCRTPSAPAVTIVTGPLGGTISAPAVDCERTLMGRGPGAGGAHEVKAARFGVLEAGCDLGAHRRWGGDGNTNPVRLGGMVGVAERQGDAETEDRGEHRYREQSAWAGVAGSGWGRARNGGEGGD